MGDQTILFDSYIDGLNMGRLDLETLLVAFRQSILEDPNNAGRLTLVLEKKLYEGELSTAAYTRLKRELSLPDATEISANTQMVEADAEDDFFFGDAADGGVPGEKDLENNIDQAETVITSAGQEFDKTQHVERQDTSAGTLDPSGKRATLSDWPVDGSLAGDAEVLEVGAIIKERFQLLQVLGKGGMGVVFKAIDQRKVEAQDRDPYLAVKVLNEAFKQHPQALKALQREARKTQELAHPNIMTVYDFDRQGSNVYMTMEFMDGEELADVIKKRKKENNPFSQEEALNIISQMCAGLGYAHKKGFVHSDFKPGNVFVTKNGTVKLLDFGIASRVKPSNTLETLDGDKTAFDPKELGAFTPAYASCEILEGEISHPTDDLYALACVAYQLLGGKHPFNRLKATDARDAGIKPAFIPELTKRQNRALVKGLAFTRTERSASVEEFLDGLKPKKSRTLPIAVGIAASVIVLLLALRGPVVSYLNEQKENELLSKLTSEDQATMEPALIELGAVDDYNIRRNILEKGRENILGYFTDVIENAIDDGRQNYDYPKAEKLLEEARQFYPDSAQIARIEESISTRKSKVVNELTTAFNDLIDRGELLPIEGKRDIPTILAIVSKIDPNHSLLKNPRLEPAYSRAANVALSGNNLDHAEALVLAGLERFSENSNLLNIRDEIRVQRQELNETLTIARIEEKLKGQQVPTSLTGFDEIRTDLLTLKNLAPSNPLIARYSDQLDRLVKNTLVGIQSIRGWQSGQKILADYGDLLDDQYVRATKRQLASAQAELDKEIDVLFDQFVAAVKNNQLTKPSQPNATGMLAKMAKLAPSDIRVQRSRSQLALHYQRLAREAGAQQKWQSADQYLNLALAQEPATLWQDALEFERGQLANAEKLSAKNAAEQEVQNILANREVETTALYQEFDKSLPKLYEDPDITPLRLLALLSKISAINPEDPQVAVNMAKVAALIDAKAKGLADNQEWQKSIDVLHMGLLALPESDSLATALRKNISANIAQLAKAEKEQEQQLQLAIEGLLASPDFGAEWRNSLRDQLTELAEVSGPDTQWLKEIRNRIADLYIDRAATSVSTQRFAEARSLLNSGQRLLPENTRFEQELGTLATAQAEFNKNAEQQASMAEIEGRKETLLTQAKANDVENALLTFKKLKSALPAADPFITKVAPKAIGTAYYNSAKRLADGKKYQEAFNLVEKGLAIDPNHTQLKKIQTDIRQDAYLAELSGQAAKAIKLDAGRYLEVLGELNKNAPKRYELLVAEVGTALEKRILSLNEKDAKSAAGLLASAKTLFPQHPGLAAINLSPREKPAQTTGTTGTAKAWNCGKSIAGYGIQRRGVCFDMLASNTRGPLMVVVPGEKTFAISKFEISVNDYNKFCANGGSCQVLKSNDKLPATGIPVSEVKKYAHWLSERTGYEYRLPTDNEWVYAATAGGKTGSKDFNCLLKMGGKILKGSAMLPVNSGKPNGWGLINHLGNAQEMVTEGESIALRGGAYNDLMSKCAVSLKRSLSGNADEVTGFRLVREIKG